MCYSARRREKRGHSDLPRNHKVEYGRNEFDALTEVAAETGVQLH